MGLSSRKKLSVNGKSPKQKKTRLVQSFFKVSDKKQKLCRCPDCNMSYFTSIASDIAEHEKYHDLHLKGRKWSPNWGIIVSDFTTSLCTYSMPSSCFVSSSGSVTDMFSGNATKTKSEPKVLSKGNNKDGPYGPESTYSLPISSGSGKSRTTTRSAEYIVMVSPSNKSETRAALEIMNIVNNELSAPHNENYFWSGIDNDCIDDSRLSVQTDYKNQGKAFIYVKNDRAIGVITVEYLAEEEKRGCWMILGTKDIVPQVSPIVKLGISRIWVCKNHRGEGIALRLLETARKYSIYGTEVAKWELAWSQPSESGGELAKKYNSVFHEKSGKLLIPCYI